MSDLPHQKRIILYYLRIVLGCLVIAELLKESVVVAVCCLWSLFQHIVAMSKFSSAVKFDMEKFDGRINFGFWKVQVKDVLIQSGLHKALEGKVSSKDSEKSESSMSGGDWEELDLRAASTIHLCLAKNVLANVQEISTAKELWKKLEGLYQAKGISNRLLLKEQFHTLRMNEDGASSENGSELDASSVSLIRGEGDFL
ncbi:cytochrome p450 [Senna tora]|uniref:Cytochrome p450 n=1 Tax=Senna tora TaxID=362788 RepID=A0A834TL92_9FABA|nr:cytochrome p450 [Senna tora]